MSDLRTRVIRLAHERPDLRPHLLPLLEKQADAKSDFRLKFPSHSVRDALDKLYDQFNRYHSDVQRAARRSPELKSHATAVDTALRTWVSLLAQVKESELHLYR